MDSALKYFDGNELAASVWASKYANAGESTPDDMHRRMARELAPEMLKFDKKYTEEYIFSQLERFSKIVPQGSIMSMLGNKEHIGSLSNCFVAESPHDSYSGILATDEALVQLMKRRGGVGVDISTLRPRGTKVHNAAGSSTGAPSFMNRYSNTTREVAQDGRRGALMLTIDVRHPDVGEFVNIKQDRTKVTGANISVQLRDEFMEAVKADADYTLRWPCDVAIELFMPPMVNGKIIDVEYGQLYKVGICDTPFKSYSTSVGYIKRIRAKDLYTQIIHNAWENAEPGLMFKDRHIDCSPDGVYDQYRFVTTNPCGEIGMSPWDACRLLAINLYSFVTNKFETTAAVNFAALFEASYFMQIAADAIVSIELKHIDKIITHIMGSGGPVALLQREANIWSKVKAVAEASRRTGCGFTALGDTLAALGHKYDSDKGIGITAQIMDTMMRGELSASIDLAKKFGPFKGWDPEKETNLFFIKLKDRYPALHAEMQKYGRRNVSWSTVAPTGSVSILTQTSSGMEPMFRPFYIRRKKINASDGSTRVDFVDQNGDKWLEYPVMEPRFKEWLLWFGKNPDTLTKEEAAVLFEQSPWYRSTSEDIDWVKRVEMQATIQQYISHSISSTINLPNSATEQDVAEIYMTAWEQGLKGVTVYRDGCRSGVLVTDTVTAEFTHHDAPKRPKRLDGELHHTTVAGIPWTVSVGLLSDKPYEIFAAEGKLGKHGQIGFIEKQQRGLYSFVVGNETIVENVLSGLDDNAETITRLISTSLRHGAAIDFVVEQLGKTSGSVVSPAKALARVLRKYAKMEGKVSCKECGSHDIERLEGCLTCKNCGASKCS